ncbi:MAG: SPFH domain-containing protein [Fimbriimonadaceae bacterium]|nr:SPFH domain-containing protein [Fimbriimonadaceae bacterium]
MDERKGRTLPGAFMLVVDLLLILGGLGLLIWGAQNQIKGGAWIGLLSMIIGFLVACGFLVIEPNGSKVLILFGSYKGTVKAAGFHWVNPFTIRREVSLRARTLNGERLKVNDSMGNPIEIAAVIVWQVEDTYDALFRVDRYEEYVAMQSETALRHSASIFPYDAGEDQISLRRNTTEVADHLATELRERLEISGVKILEARLSHLAYAPEIAGAMLRRQQASAVIAARQIIVDGAVGMVELALARIERENLVKLDEERKAAMVSNLMVVLCSEQAAQPVLNTGSLYT